MAAAPTTGFLLGKFLPPHRGHQYLIEFARAYVDRLTVLVCSIAREPIPGALRYQWMCESFPGVTLVHHTDEIPQAPEEHRQFWDIWRGGIRRHVPGRMDYVFASEDYGGRLAEELGARFVPVDIERRNVPVSGRAIRDDPMTHWEALLPAVRPYYLKRVCVFDDGPPSLADLLAAEFRTVCVHRYDGPRDSELGRGRSAAAAALSRQANRVLICEADAATATLLAEEPRFDLYLVPESNHTGAMLAARGLPVVRLHGPRETHADQAAAVIRHIVAPRQSEAARDVGVAS
jgi:HTH-type transcriptional regulator, transcriptional repressor of NAD biosynthesis genes